jgi:hypothetical protein
VIVDSLCSEEALDMKDPSHTSELLKLWPFNGLSLDQLEKNS